MLPKATPPPAAAASSSASATTTVTSPKSSSPGSSADSVSGPALNPDGSVRPEVEVRLRALMASAPAVLFMKGSPASPACGFSDRMCALLKAHAISFKGFDILSDPQAREGLKVLNAWPTFPQLCVHGKLVGGLDVIKVSKAALMYACSVDVTSS